MKRCLLLTLSLLIPVLLPGQQPAPNWEPFAPGVEGEPARFPITAFFPSLNESGRRTLKPRLVLSPEGHAVVIVHSQAATAFTGESGFFSFRQRPGQGWNPFLGGRVWTVNGLAIPRGYSVAGGRAQIAVAAPAVPAGELASNLYATFTGGGSPWQQRGGSQQNGGLSASNTFNPTVQNAFTHVDSFDNVYTGWSFGGNDQTSLHVGRWLLGGWQGFPGSITTPVYTSPQPYRILSPTMTFTGGSPVLLFTEASGTQDRVRAIRYRSIDNRWIDIGSAVDGIGTGRHIQALNRGNAANFLMSFENVFTGQLSVLEWTGSTFRSLPGAVQAWGLDRMAPLPTTTTNLDASLSPNHALAFDQRGWPAVAFRAQHPSSPGKFHLYVSILDPATGEWAPIGDESSPLGASRLDYTIQGANAAGHRHPTLAFTLDNRPILAWELDTGASTGPVIHIRRFSRGLGDGLPTRRQAAARLLGVFDRDILFDSRMLGSNTDTILDAADIVRLSN